VEVNPVALLVTAVRDIMSGGSDTPLLLKALIAPAITTILCVPIAMKLYSKER
jgi:ABC-type polysaccharide/polyol phosphate export permease